MSVFTHAYIDPETNTDGSFYSQNVRDDTNGPAVHSLTVGLLGQNFWSCRKSMVGSGLGTREDARDRSRGQEKGWEWGMGE